MHAAVRANAATRATRSGTYVAPRASAVSCPSCGRSYPLDYAVCPRDGATLGALSSEDPLVGAVVAGSYRVVRRIARGGMGRLYEAEQLRLGKTVTLKVLHDHLASNDELVARFEREARAASRIESPFVLSVIDVVRTPCGRPAIVAEFLVGHDLQNELDRNQRPSLPDALAWTASVARGLADAHAVGVIHRDVKPANVFLCETARGLAPKVLDFGVAKLLDEELLTQTGAVVGTPAYMSPEQARSAQLADARSDVYSVGALLHRLATGATPYEPGDASTTLARILTDEPRRPRDLAPELPIAVEAVIQRAMARDPAMRFASMAELADAIEAVRRELFESPPEGAHFVRRLTRSAEHARPRAIASAAFASLATGAAAAAIAGSFVTHPGAHEARLLAGLAALVAGAGVAVPMAERFRASWRSAPAVFEAAKATAESTAVGLATFGSVEIVLRGASAIAGVESTPSPSAVALGLLAATLVTFRRRAR